MPGLGAALIGAGVGGSLAGLGQKKPNFDISGLLNTINQGATRQTQIASDLPGKLAPLGTTYQTGISGALNTAQTARQQNAADFLKSLGQNQNLQGQDLTKLLTQQAFSGVPAAERAARESAAASGGLQRGAAAELTAAPSAAAAEQVGAGLTQLDLQQQQQKAQALDKINTMTDNAINQTLGIDRDTLTAIYSSGRQDLIDQANELLGISQQQTADTLSAYGAANNANLASTVAQNQGTQGLYNTLTGLGGILAARPLTAAPRTA